MNKLTKPTKKSNIKSVKTLNLTLVFSVLLLSLLGVVFVFSASSYSAQIIYGSKFYFFTKQIFGVVLGVCGLLFFAFIDYHKLEKFKIQILVISIILLTLVFVPGLGVENYGAKRWLGILGITIQPSEIAKLAFVIFCASYLSKKYKQAGSLKTFVPVVLVGCLLCGLIIIEPNMSITMVIAITMLIMLFLGGIKIKYLVFLFLPILALGVLLILIEPYRLSRLMAFLNPWDSPKGDGYQLIQSLYGLAEGGLFGVGLFNSRQKYLFLPFAESDFIFSIIGEELGLLGCFAVLALFFLIFYNGVKISKNAPDRFGSYLAIGITSVICVQVLINIAVVTGSIPPTGVPLPFVSSGSTSLLVFMSAIGIVLNIDRQSKGCISAPKEKNNKQVEKFMP